MISIKLTDNAAQIVAQLDAFPERMAQGIAQAMDFENELTDAHIVKDKLTNAGPQYLNVRTGRMRRSVNRSRAVVSGRVIRSAIGSNVGYAGVHEDGFQGTVAVAAFMRQAPEGDKFSVNGDTVSRTVARSMGLFDSKGRLRKRKNLSQVSSGRSMVKAHTRKVNFRARHMFRDGITDRMDNYKASVSAAIVEAWT